MEPEAFSRQIGQILGSAPFTMDERDKVLEAMGLAGSIEDMPDDVILLLNRVLAPENRHLPGKHNQATQSRSSRLSTVERRIIKDSDQCPQCIANNDPNNVPVHPNCHCDVVTDSIESGVADRASRFFNPLNPNDVEIEVVNGELPEGEGILLDPETAAILDAENARWADLARWLETIQPYLEAGNNYVSIVVDDETEEALAQIEETLQTIAEDSDQLIEAIRNRKLWFALAKAVVL